MIRAAAFGLIALGLTVTACSGGGSAEPPAQATSEPQSSTSTPPPAEPVESATCRADMQPIVDVMLANRRDGLEFDDFRARNDRLTAEIDNALLACSAKVERPARKVMYQFALANAGIQVCLTGATGACTNAFRRNSIVKPIVVGLRSADKVQLALDATT